MHRANFRIIFKMFTYGTVTPEYHNKSYDLKWRMIGKEDNPTEKSFVCSPQFELPKSRHENGPFPFRLFLDFDKKEIGIENVSSEKGSVVITGSVSICYITYKGKISPSIIVMLKNKMDILLFTRYLTAIGIIPESLLNSIRQF